MTTPFDPYLHSSFVKHLVNVGMDAAHFMTEDHLPGDFCNEGSQRMWLDWKQAIDDVGHKDSVSIMKFASTMNLKMAMSRKLGRGGWDNPEECSTIFLSLLLHQAVEKGDPLDVANYCMMLYNRGSIILPKPGADTRKE